MAQDASALLPALRDMFPTLSDDILLAALEAHNNQIENVIPTLLEMCVDAAEAVISVKFPATSVRNAVTNSQRSTSRSSEVHPAVTNPANTSCALDRIKADDLNRTQTNHAPVPSPTRPKPAKSRCPSTATTTTRTTSSTRKTWAQLRGEQLTPALGSYQNQGGYMGSVPQPQQPQSQPRSQTAQRSSSSSPALLPSSNRWPQSPQYVAPGSLPIARLAAADFPNLVGLAAVQRPASAAADWAVLRDERSADGVLFAGRGPAGDGRPASACTWSGGATSTARSPTGATAKCSSPKVEAAQRTAVQGIAVQRLVAPGAGCGMLAGGYAQAARLPPPSEWPVGYGSGGGGDRKAYDTGGTDGEVSDAWQRNALDELCRSHTWADRDVVEAVCLALQYDLEEVVATLDELAAASYQDQQSGDSGSETTGAESSFGSSSNASRSAVGTAFSLEEEEKGANHHMHPDAASADMPESVHEELHEESEEDEVVLEGRGNKKASAALGRGRSAVGSASGDDFVVGTGMWTGAAVRCGAVHKSRGGLLGGGLGEGGGYGSGNRGRRAEGKDGGGRRGRGDGDEDDVYGRHRHAALKLTHAWRKKMNKASTAFAEGDRALGRQLVVEAQQLRQQAATAHGKAAAAIEAELNDGRQLGEWQLDLHGLHADEAVQKLLRDSDVLFVALGVPCGCSDRALARRIATLELGTTPSSSRNPPHRNNNDTTSATATEQNTTNPMGRRGAVRQGRRREVAANETCSLQVNPQPNMHKAQPGTAAAASAAMGVQTEVVAGRQQDLSSQVLAARRVLRVVVGKGLHSSGGEASLPRVVQTYLMERGYRFTPRAGVVEVQLHRRYAAQSGAVLAGQRTK